MKNPFTLSFGKKPAQFISRLVQTNEIIENFEDEIATTQIYMLTGVRGSGKTVLMTNIAGVMEEKKDWIVIELNPTRDMLQGLASKLYSISEMQRLFIEAKLNFSTLGFGVSIEGVAPITDIESAIERMLELIKKQKKRLLITVDEVTNSEYVRVFSSAFQIFIRKEYPIYLLMTGLYDNIYDLQNDKSLTFLYRAPKVILEPLNYTAVRKCYMDIFEINEEMAGEMARLTRGYPFAFQVLGYLYWNKREQGIEGILAEYDQYLEEYVYSKIWSEMSDWDKKILKVISVSGETRVKNIREKIKMKSEQFAVYRDRLKRKGVINTEEYGRIKLALPRFEEFVIGRYQ